jgi:hypothetical protein
MANCSHRDEILPSKNAIAENRQTTGINGWQEAERLQVKESMN